MIHEAKGVNWRRSISVIQKGDMGFWYLVLSELVLLQSGRYHFYPEVTSQTYGLVGVTVFCSLCAVLAPRLFDVPWLDVPSLSGISTRSVMWMCSCGFNGVWYFVAAGMALLKNSRIHRKPHEFTIGLARDSMKQSKCQLFMLLPKSASEGFLALGLLKSTSL